MKFVIITKQKLQNIPPLISVAYILNDLGHDVHVISCGITTRIKEEFAKRSIESEEYSLVAEKNPIIKVFQYLKFRYVVKKRLSQISFDYLWIEAGYTIRSLGTFIKQYNYILQLSELHEQSPATLKAIHKVIYNAGLVFMPEYNRAFIYKGWFHLKNLPVVLPNKPYYLPTSTELALLEDNYSDYVNIFKKYKVILYQGRITDDRDLSFFAEAISRLGDDYRFVLMGSYTEMLKKYKRSYPNIIHIDFITPPDYLLFTSLCHIGIVCYDPIILNNAYCAPNKIYEYSAFGKPIIGNDIPGLKVLKENGFGILVDDSDVNSIVSAINELEKKYDQYSNCAHSFYNNCRNDFTIKEAVSSLNKKI